MLDVVTPLMQTLQAQATLEHTQQQTNDIRALAQQRMINTQILQNQLQQGLVTRQAMQQFYAAQPTDATIAASPDDTPMQSAQKNILRMQQQANQQQQLLQSVARAGGDPKMIDTLNDNVTNLNWRITQARREMQGERQAQNKLLGGIANGINDAESFQVGYKQMADMDPQLVQKVLWDKNEMGQPMWGPTTQRTLKAISNENTTVADQLKLQNQADRISLQEQALHNREDAVRVQQQNADTRAALGQTTGELRQAQAELAKVRAAHVGDAKAARQPEVKPASKKEREDALDAVTNEFPDAKWEAGSQARFATDIADRAKKIMADAKRNGQEIGMDDARDQALDELKGFVADKTVTKPGVFGMLLGGNDVSVKTYTKGGKAAAPAAAPEVTTQEQYDKLPKGAPYTFNGKSGVKK